MKNKAKNFPMLITIALNISAIYELMYSINSLLKYESWLEYTIGIIVLGLSILIPYKVVSHTINRKLDDYLEYELAKEIVYMQIFNTITIFLLRVFSVDNPIGITVLNVVLLIYAIVTYNKYKEALKIQLMTKIIDIQKQLVK